MAEAFSPEALPASLAERYTAVQQQLDAIVEGEASETARYATAACLLYQAFSPRFLWAGFYVVDPLNPRQLVVGPYQGTLGCLRIDFGRGVCGAAAASRKTVLVPDVHAFPGHIACDSRSRSEVVVPVFDAVGRLAAVLDVDSAQPDAFTSADVHGLERLCASLLPRP